MNRILHSISQNGSSAIPGGRPDGVEPIFVGQEGSLPNASKKSPKTIDNQDSLMVTHLTTNWSACSLSCLSGREGLFSHSLWSIAKDHDVVTVYRGVVGEQK
jgi:hypothetical protein